MMLEERNENVFLQRFLYNPIFFSCIWLTNGKIFVSMHNQLHANVDLPGT